MTCIEICMIVTTISLVFVAIGVLMISDNLQYLGSMLSRINERMQDNYVATRDLQQDIVGIWDDIDQRLKKVIVDI